MNQLKYILCFRKTYQLSLRKSQPGNFSFGIMILFFNESMKCIQFVAAKYEGCHLSLQDRNEILEIKFYYKKVSFFSKIVFPGNSRESREWAEKFPGTEIQKFPGI